MFVKWINLKDEVTGKKLKSRSHNQDCVAYVTFQVKHGVSFEEAVRKIGYYPKLFNSEPFTPPNCGSHIKVPKGQQEVLLEQLLEEVKRIKIMLTIKPELEAPDDLWQVYHNTNEKFSEPLIIIDAFYRNGLGEKFYNHKTAFCLFEGTNKECQNFVKQWKEEHKYDKDNI